MKNLNELRDELKLLQEKYSNKYFIFIAPYNLQICEELAIFDHFVCNKIQPPDHLLNEQHDLEIYFVEHRHISGMKSSKPLAFKRLSTTDLNKL